MAKMAPLRSIVTQHLLETNRRRQKNWVTVNINLFNCREYVVREDRRDLKALDKAVSPLLQELEQIIFQEFRANFSSAAANARFQAVFDLGDESYIYITVSDTKITLEGTSKNKTKLNKIRQLLNDFKLDQETREDTSKTSSRLLEGRRRERISVAKLLGEIPDPRFIPVLRQALHSDASFTVRREALRALGQLEYAEWSVDLQQAHLAFSGTGQSIAAAFLHGNQFGLVDSLPGFLPGTLAPKDRTSGCLTGLVVADILGRPIEFLSRDLIAMFYGGPVTDLVASTKTARIYGQPSDDTELTLMMAEAIDPKKGFQLEVFAGFLAEHALQIDTWGIPNHGYGATTMAAARRLYQGIPSDQSGVDASTCGPAIRVAPLAIYYHNRIDLLEELLVSSSRITHANSIASAGAVAVGLAIARIINLDPSFDHSDLIAWLSPKVAEHDQELAEKLKLANRLALDPDLSIESAYGELGNSSETREVVPMAFYSFLRSPHDYRATVLTAINAGGDADSSGSIAGSLSGALNGIKAIPQRWTDKVADLFLVNQAINKLTQQA